MNHDLTPWDRRTRTWWGITIRVVFGLAGVALAVSLALLVVGILFFTLFTGGVWPFENMSVPAGLIVIMGITAVASASTTVAAAMRPTKEMAAIGAAGLVVALALLGYLVFG